jgi:hypothetical protein
MGTVNIRGNVVTIDMSISDNKLAELLEAADPDEREGLVINLLEVAVMTRSAFKVDLETQTIRESVDTAKSELAKYFEAFKADLTEHLEILTDPQSGEFVTSFKLLVDEKFRELLNPDLEYPESPIHKLKNHVFSASKNIEEALLPIKAKLGLGVDENPSERGHLFEATVVSLLHGLNRNFGDEISAIGDSTAGASTSKKGDILATLNIDHLPGINPKVVFEVKTGDEFKKPANSRNAYECANDDQIRKELNRQMELHSAKAAVFILDDNNMNMEFQPRWKIYDDNKLLVVLNRNTPDGEYLQLAYAWSRWKASAKTDAKDTNFNPGSFKTGLENALTHLKDLKNIKTRLTNAMTGIGETQGLIDTMEKHVKEEIQTLLDQIPSSKAKK